MFSIRQPNHGDISWITLACQDAEIQRWTLIPRPFSTDHAIAFIDNSIGEAHRWVIENTLDAQPLGVIGIHSVDTHSGSADIGYWIAPWGRRIGAATAAILLVEQFSLTDPAINNLSARIATTNLASQKTVIRAGFTNLKTTTETCPDGVDQVPTLLFEKTIR